MVLKEFSGCIACFNLTLSKEVISHGFFQGVWEPQAKQI